MLKVMKYRRQAKLARRQLQTLIGGALDLVILTQSGLGEESQRCASDLLQHIDYASMTRMQDNQDGHPNTASFILQIRMTTDRDRTNGQ